MKTEWLHDRQVSILEKNNTTLGSVTTDFVNRERWSAWTPTIEHIGTYQTREEAMKSVERYVKASYA
jgi:hypothetical protein